MSRLVDADSFKRQVSAVVVMGNLSVEKGNAMCELIDRQPTAYDVDKVVEKLEDMIDSITHNISLNSQGENIDEEILNEISHYRKIIKIVKSGGVE